MHHTIRMKVDCHIIPKTVMVPAVVMAMMAVMAVAMVVDVVAVIVVDMALVKTMIVGLLPPVLQMQCRNELMHRPRVIWMMMPNFSRIT